MDCIIEYLNESNYYSEEEESSINCGDDVFFHDEVMRDDEADHEIVQKIKEK